MEDMRERETLREGAEELVMAEKERIQGVRCSGSFTLHGFFFFYRREDTFLFTKLIILYARVTTKQYSQI